MDIISLPKNIMRRIVGKCLSVASRPVKASLWYRCLFVDYDHTTYPDNVWYREHDERNYDIVSLGSSGAKWAYDWNAAGLKGMNWAQQPQTLIDDFRLLKNFHSILKKNGVVLITIMPFTGLNKRTGVIDTFKYLETLYWDVVKDMPHLADAQRLRTYPILLGKPAVRAAIRHILGREKQVRDWRLDIEDNPMTPEALRRDARMWMEGWSRQFGIKDFDAELTEENQQGRKIRVKVMQDMVDFCLERGYRPVYVIPPVTNSLLSCYSDKFRKRYFYDYLQEVGRNVRLLDYLGDPEFSDDDLYFNSFFLNKRGRGFFTKRVFKDIEEAK